MGVRQYRNHIVGWCDIEYEEEAGQTEQDNDDNDDNDVFSHHQVI